MEYCSKNHYCKKNLSLILGATQSLPVQYWQPGFLFFKALDTFLHQTSMGRFPAKLEPNKTHPVFTIPTPPSIPGFRACPCSTKKPINTDGHRFIKKGCILRHTHYEMDKTSFIIDQITLIIPLSIGSKLRFKGEVPDKCIISFKKPPAPPVRS